MNNRRKIILIIFVLLLLTIIFFWYFIFDVTSFYGDGAGFWYPHLSFVINSIHNKQLPLWDPFDFSGRPCIGDTAAGVFYPLFWPLIFFIKGHILSFLAMEYVAVFHVFLAGLFMFLFVRILNLSLFSSLVSAIIFMFSGALAYIDCTLMAHLTWCPFILLFLQKSLDNKDYKYAVLGSLGLGLTGLYFNPHFYIFMVYAIGIYFIYNLWQKKKFGASKQELFFEFRSFLVLIIIGVALAAIQIIPTIELVLNSARAKISWSQSVYNSLHPKQLINFFIPYFLVEPPRWMLIPGYEEYHIYIGILPLILAFIGMVFSHHSKRKFFIILFIVCLLYALGKYGPVQPIFYYLLPGLNKVRGPTRINWLCQFALAILAGMGMDVLLQLLKNDLKDKIYLFYRIINRVAIILLSVTLLVTIFWLTSVNFKTILELASTRMIKNTYIFLLLLFASLVLLNLYFKNRIKTPVFKILVLSLIILDLFYIQTKIHTYKLGHGRDRFPRLARVEFIRKDPDVFRVLTDVGGDFEMRDRVLKNNWGSVYGIQNAGGYVPINLATMADMFQMQNTGILLQLLNIKYIITKYSFIDDGELVFNDGEYNVFKLNSFLPRVYFVKSFEIIEDPVSTLDYLASQNFKPTETVLLSENPHVKLDGGGSNNQDFPSIKILRYTNNAIEVSIDTKSNGFLVFSEVFYPGWCAYVNNIKTKIYKANYGFRSVYLVKGHNKVLMVYKPLSFYVGLSISLMTIFCIIFYLAFRLLKIFK